jgi:LysR family transcriptional regulator for metE and metH
MGMQRERPVLDVADLELVLALAEAGSTVRASTRLHVTQSAVSRGLTAVEEKLGVSLFERKARGLELTAAGRRLTEAAGPLLAQLVDLEERTRTGAATNAPLRVVCECYTAYSWLPGALSRLGPALGTELEAAIDHTHAPIEALLTGDADVALLTTSKVPQRMLEAPLFHDEIVFVVAAAHPLAARPAIGAHDLEQHALIVSSSTPEPERKWFFRQVFGRGAPRLKLLRFPLTEAVIEATRAGMGIAAMSEWVARPYVAGGGLVARSLQGKRLERPWRIAYRREVAAAATRLATALRGAPPRLLEGTKAHAGRG